MAYLLPPWFVAKIFNRIAMATGVGSSETLTVTTRARCAAADPGGRPRGRRGEALVSTRGESQWVKNVRADPNVTLGGTKYIASEIPVEQRAPILAAYKPRPARSRATGKAARRRRSSRLRAHTDGLTLATTPCSLVCRLGCDTGGHAQQLTSPRSCSPMPAPSYPAG